MKIAIAGLGQMGRPIAINLFQAGLNPLAVGRPDQVEALRADGLEAEEYRSRLREADLVLLCLPDIHAIRQVLFGEDRAGGVVRSGQTVVDLGTTDHAETLILGSTLADRGVDFLDAPVSGMAARAAEGTLTVMCGGEREVFDRVLPVLRAFGERILFMGPAGSGQLAKLVNQLLFDINVAALAEILPLAVKLGLQPGLVGEVVNSGTGRSFASEFFVPRILRGSFTDGYPMRSAYKDLASGARMSAESCIPLPVLAAATGTYQTALLAGHGDKDKGAMVLVLEQLLGVAFRDEPTLPPTGSGGDS
jgi:3-hydroxyisobutyrate dehydrogenase-like beta-hydroxyacid dehydrogenase